MNREYLGKAEGKQWEALGKPDGQIPASYPRGTFVACFRLLMGHDFLGRHLFRIGVFPHLIPILEGVRLENSEKEESSRRALLYWAARARMAEVANAPAEEKKSF
ncbi:hypothetical protein O3M35_005779 [Rhynocoris fuscipes]|uniref:Uncharacterized protein n=1 Tax=Rhynocoris fuscipes TaxID=488301 RepID=A0AAW1DQB9_9HEMI